MKISWAYISQFIAAVSVVISLVFVGYEIRQNTAVAKSEAAQAFTQQIIDINAILVSGSIPEINVKLIAGTKREEFSAEEQFILDMNLLSLIRVWESVYRSVQADIVDEELLSPISNNGPGPFQTIYFQESWPNYKLSFTQDFVEYFESELNL